MTKLHEEITRAPLLELLKSVAGREVKGELTLVVEGKRDG
jgi:16S rRNA C1402 (ribose-2'-O) methylase RsmI